MVVSTGILDRADVSLTNSNFQEHTSGELSRSDITQRILNVIHETLNEGSSAPGKVISIYGMGGEGKTHLIEKLKCQLTEEKDPRAIIIFHNFYDYQTTPLERVLKDLAMLFEYEGIPCPGFIVTYYAYRSLKSNAQKAFSEFKEDCGHFSSSNFGATLLQASNHLSPFLDAVFGIQGIPVPVGGMLNAVVQIAAKSTMERRERIVQERWQQIERFNTISELYQQLAPMLAQDLESWSRSHPDRKLIVLFDTFERLSTGSGYGLDRCGWAQMLTKTTQSLWIISGRNKICWENSIQGSFHIVDMNDDEANELLVKSGVSDPDIRKTIIYLAKGLPLYLNICAKQYTKLSGETFSNLDLSERPEELLENFLRYIDDDNRQLVYTAAFLERWDDKLIEDLIDSLGFEADSEFLSSLSFVKKRGNLYEMHEVAADVLRHSKRIRSLKRDLYDLTESMLCKLRNDTETPENNRIKAILGLLRMRCRLLDSGISYNHISNESAFAAYMEYAEYTWKYGNIDVAMRLFQAIEDNFGSNKGHKGPTREKLLAELKVAALYTQYFLAGRGDKCHLHAISIAEDVLKQARAYFPNDELLIQSALNDLGISWARLKNYKKAFEYQEGLYEALKQKDVALLTVDEARFINNYGSTRQQYGDSLESKSEKEAQYRVACEAYCLSLHARQRLTGKRSLSSLITQTNLGVIQARLGNYDAAREVVESAKLRYSQAGFDRSTPGLLRCEYQLAMFDEQEASDCIERGKKYRARQLIASALERHQRVFNDRKIYLPQNCVDTQKSAEQIRKCKELLNECLDG